MRPPGLGSASADGEGTVTEGWLHDTLEQLIAQIRTLLDVTGVAFVIDRRGPRRDPPRGRLVRHRGGLARVHPAARTAPTTRARRRHRGGGRVRHRGADPAASASGRAPRGCASASASAWRRPLAELAWDFYSHRVVHLRARAHGGRAHVRRARDLLQPAAAPRSPPRTCARSRCSRGSRRWRSSAPSCWSARPGCAARRGCSTARCRPSRARSTSRPSTARSSSRRRSCRGATTVMLSRFDPGPGELRHVAGIGVSERMVRARFRLGEGMIGHVAATGEPYVSTPGDEARFLRWVVETRGRRVVHARADHARRAAVRRADRDAPGARALRRGGPAAARRARRRRGGRDRPRARVRARAPDRPRADRRLRARAARPA